MLKFFLKRLTCFFAVLSLFSFSVAPCSADEKAKKPRLHEKFFANHCYGCHGEALQEGGLNLESLARDLGDRRAYKIWVKIQDRLKAGEMPPSIEPQPKKAVLESVTKFLDQRLLAAGESWQAENGRAPIRRLTRAEYENTIGDLLDIEGAPLKQLLPEDGLAHDTDKHADALDLSYVQIRQYMAAADRAMDLATVTFPEPPEVKVHRVYPQRYYQMAQLRRGMTHLITKDKKRDPRIPPAAKPIEKDFIKNLNLRNDDSPEANRSLGILLNRNQIWKFGASLPGKYRVRGSFWSFDYNRGKIDPTENPQIAALLVQDPRAERVLGYAEAPSKTSTVTEFITWLNPHNRLGWKAAIHYPVERDLAGIKDRAAGYRGSGIAVDWIEMEGPLFDRWPPESHRRLFGDLPLKPLAPSNGIRLPERTKLKAGRFFYPPIPKVNVPFRDSPRDVPLHAAENSSHGPFTPTTETPLIDAKKLLAKFLLRAFRRPVPEKEIDKYVAIVKKRLADGDCFENAMRLAYQSALCSYSFLYRVEDPGELNDHQLATRLAYFLWNTTPDAELLRLAEEGRLREPKMLQKQVDRMLADPKFNRFIADFLDQWLDLDEINATTPDEKLYPEFQPFLSDMMLAESRAYFREMILKNRPAGEIVDSDWAMLNTGVAELYGVPEIDGPESRHVKLPADSPRGGLITQAGVLKVTADGTSTSPVRRGTFLLEKILGVTPTPPPPDVGNVDPDVRGATTIRELLAKHRDNASCTSCHAQIDPPGFALESFDPIGQFRKRYRGTEVGDDPNVVYPNTYKPEWLYGPAVDSSGRTEDGRQFAGIEEYREILNQPEYQRRVARNLLERMVIYATGAGIQYADRPKIESLMKEWKAKGSGLRDLIALVVQSKLFLKK